MQKLEDFVNSFTDQNWGWWPVVSLRPPKDRDIDNLTLLKMTCFFGPATGAVMLLFRVRSLEGLALQRIALHLVLGCVAFFILYKFSFAFFWNRRARRLRAKATQPSPPLE
jgi:hypothetical protein